MEGRRREAGADADKAAGSLTTQKENPAEAGLSFACALRRPVLLERAALWFRLNQWPQKDAASGTALAPHRPRREEVTMPGNSSPVVHVVGLGYATASGAITSS